MMTVITETTIELGQEPAWDKAFAERFADVANEPGWVGVQLLIPVDEPNKRVVVGTWSDRASWQTWHSTDVFQRTRQAMDAVQQSSGSEHWYEVVQHGSRGG